MPNVPSDDDQIMNQRSRCDEKVGKRRTLGKIKCCAFQGNGFVDWQHTFGELRTNLSIEPRSQLLPVLTIVGGKAQDAIFQFHQADH